MGTIVPGWRLWFGVVASVPIGVILSVVLSTRIAEKNTEELLRQQCSTNRAVIQAYRETPPTSAAGRNVEKAYIDQYRILGCPAVED